MPEHDDGFGRLLEAALDLDPGERAVFIAGQCGEDSGLRDRLESAVAAADDNQFCRPLSDVVRERAAHDDLTGKTVGQYELISVLGKGAMGIVYRARQLRPKREVALKLIGSRFTSEKLRRRFEHETEILGRLHHSGIAQIYEAGTSENNERPFFAMELVAGRSLTEYAEAQGLSIRARLRLFAEICDAVHHAHQKGVIHRDLKPGNILVTEDGQAKVLDFGVARAVDSDLQVTTLATDVAQLIGTIPYMSPEQVGGHAEDLDTRSDVYALGVVLYELLTGKLPYDLSGKLIPEAARIIQDEEPTRLSSVAPKLGGDVEIIVGKALQKEKGDRYQSAAELAADVRRYLAEEPIVARPPSATYQLKKFAKRNRGVVVALAVIFVVLCAGIVTSTTLAFSEARQRRLAEEREKEAVIAREDSAALTGFMREMLSAADPYTYDPDLTMRELLDIAARRVPEVFGDRPHIESQLRQTLSSAYWSLGDYESALEHADKALEHNQGRELQDPDQVISAMMQRAKSLQGLGQLDHAEQILHDALSLQEKHGAFHRTDRLAIKAVLATVLIEKGDLAAGREIHEEVLAATRSKYGEDHFETVLAWVNVSLAYLAENRTDEATEILSKFLPKILDPSSPIAFPLAALTNLSAGLTASGQYDEAKSLTARVVAIAEEQLGSSHPQLIIFKMNLAIDLSNSGHRKEGAHLLEELVVDENVVQMLPKKMITVLRFNLATAYLLTGRERSAAELFLKIEHELSRSQEDADGFYLRVRRNRAETLRALGEYDEALKIHKATLESSMRLLGADHVDTLSSRYSIGSTLADMGQLESASTILAECLVRARDGLGESHPQTMQITLSLAEVKRRQTLLDDADQLSTQVRQRARSSLGKHHPLYLSASVVLASVFLDRGDFEAAESLSRELIESVSRDSEVFPDALAILGGCLLESRDYSVAQQVFVEGFELLSYRFGQNHPKTQEAIANLVGLYEQWHEHSPDDDHDASARHWKSKLSFTDTTELD